MVVVLFARPPLLAVPDLAPPHFPQIWDGESQKWNFAEERDVVVLQFRGWAEGLAVDLGMSARLELEGSWRVRVDLCRASGT